MQYYIVLEINVVYYNKVDTNIIATFTTMQDANTCRAIKKAQNPNYVYQVKKVDSTLFKSFTEWETCHATA